MRIWNLGYVFRKIILAKRHKSMMSHNRELSVSQSGVIGLPIVATGYNRHVIHLQVSWMDTLLCETCLGRHMFMYLCLTRDMSQKWLHMTYLSMCVSQMYVNQWYFIVEDIYTRLPHKKLPRHHFYSVVSNKLIKTMFIF